MCPATPPPDDAATALQGFLRGRPDAFPDVGRLRAAGLSGHASVRLEGHPERPRLQQDFRRIAVRHMALKPELARLLRGWHRAGVAALIFKGFYLAEFVYPSPGQRPYADVDLLIRQEHLDEACRTALELGWDVLWRRGAPDSALGGRASGNQGHEMAHLRHPGLKVLLDVHELLVHSNHNRLPFRRKQARVTEAARTAAREIEWEGTRILVPGPADAVLFGLVLNRCWGPDAWWVKPRDYADFEALIARHGLEREALVDRARALGVPRTLAIYLRRCDPYREMLDLRRPTWTDLRWWNMQATPERGSRDLDRGLLSALALPRRAVEVARVAPAVVRTLSLLRRGMPARSVAERLKGAEPRGRAMGYRTWSTTRRGIRRLLALLRVPPPERDLVTAVAAFAILRRRGYAVTIEFDERGGFPDARLTASGTPLRIRTHPAAPTPPMTGPRSSPGE